MDLSFLCEDLLERIITRVPLKPRTRFKCVSKRWCKMINHIRHFSPSGTSSGLVLTFQPSDLESKFATTFLTVQDKGKPCILKSSFDVDLENKKPSIVVSFNGVLLYCVPSTTPLLAVTQFFISICPVRSQCIPLPPIIRQGLLNPAIGLLPHGSRQEQFKVICFSLDHETPRSAFMYFHIFSSDTWAWTYRRAPIFNRFFYLTIKGYRFEFFNSVYNKGKLYWLYSQIGAPVMLVYNVNRQFFKFVRLPTNANSNNHPYLYQSDCCLYYCEASRQQIAIMAYIDADSDDKDYDDDDDYKSFSGNQSKKWRVTHSIATQELIKQTTETYGIGDQSYSDLWSRPVAFNDELQILYLLSPGFIWAYSLEARKITRVWSSPVGSDGNYFLRLRVLPFVFDQ